MNLTAGTLAAVVKYPYLLQPRPGRGAKGVYAEDLPSSSACRRWA